jgi:hypothetical protein
LWDDNEIPPGAPGPGKEYNVGCPGCPMSRFRCETWEHEHLGHPPMVERRRRDVGASQDCRFGAGQRRHRQRAPDWEVSREIRGQTELSPILDEWQLVIIPSVPEFLQRIRWPAISKCENGRGSRGRTKALCGLVARCFVGFLHDERSTLVATSRRRRIVSAHPNRSCPRLEPRTQCHVVHACPGS